MFAWVHSRLITYSIKLVDNTLWLIIIGSLGYGDFYVT